MGRSVSYPTGSVVAFRLLDDGEDDDVDWAYECLVDEVIDTTNIDLLRARGDLARRTRRCPVLGGRFLHPTSGEGTALARPGVGKVHRIVR